MATGYNDFLLIITEHYCSFYFIFNIFFFALQIWEHLFFLPTLKEHWIFGMLSLFCQMILAAQQSDCKFPVSSLLMQTTQASLILQPVWSIQHQECYKTSNPLCNRLCCHSTRKIAITNSICCKHHMEALFQIPKNSICLTIALILILRSVFHPDYRFMR